MTPQEAVLISQNSQRQIGNAFCFSHITAAELHDLSAAYLAALERLAQIDAIASASLMTACGGCYLERMRAIRELCKTDT